MFLVSFEVASWFSHRFDPFLYLLCAFFVSVVLLKSNRIYQTVCVTNCGMLWCSQRSRVFHCRNLRQAAMLFLDHVSHWLLALIMINIVIDNTDCMLQLRTLTSTPVLDLFQLSQPSFQPYLQGLGSAFPSIAGTLPRSAASRSRIAITQMMSCTKLVSTLMEGLLGKFRIFAHVKCCIDVFHLRTKYFTRNGNDKGDWPVVIDTSLGMSAVLCIHADFGFFSYGVHQETAASDFQPQR